MLLKDGRYIYETYLVYKYLDQRNDPTFNEFQEIKEGNRIHIYPENISKIETVFKINEYSRIEELQYKSYKLIYLANDMNVFLVNVFEKEKDYPKDLSVVYYGFKNANFFTRSIRINNKEYICLNVGKAFVEFNSGIENMNRNKNYDFWLQFKEFLMGHNKMYYFGYSEFENIIIVYTYKMLNN